MTASDLQDEVWTNLGEYDHDCLASIYTLNNHPDICLDTVDSCCKKESNQHLHAMHWLTNCKENSTI